MLPESAALNPVCIISIYAWKNSAFLFLPDLHLVCEWKHPRLSWCNVTDSMWHQRLRRCRLVLPRQRLRRRINESCSCEPADGEIKALPWWVQRRVKDVLTKSICSKRVSTQFSREPKSESSGVLCDGLVLLWVSGESLKDWDTFSKGLFLGIFWESPEPL